MANLFTPPRIALVAAVLIALPGLPVTVAAQVTPQAAAAAPVAAEARIAELEAALKRQTTIADNARQEVDRLRGELAVRDELIVLAVQRNAELYAVASEIVDKGLSKRSLEPFIQGKRVEMENLKQSYEDRLRAARFYDTTLAPSVQQRMEAELGQGTSDQPKSDDAGS